MRNKKMITKSSLGLGLSMLMILLVVMLAACQPDTAAPAENNEPEEVVQEAAPTDPPEPTAEPVPDHSEFVAAWEQSPHGNTYDLGKGPNTYCSRCHSPQNWDPEATTDTPPNCVTCKFPTDSELRIASTMDFVAEEDWVGINCETCHMVEDGVVQEGIAWLSPLTGEYLTVNTPNELCTKCHLTSQGVSATGGRGVSHEIYLGGSAHKNWAGITDTERRPEYCSDCHDPHTQEPLACVDCHSINAAEHAGGAFPEMASVVTCMACHEATGMEVGPHPDEEMGGIWVPIVSELNRRGEMTSTAVVSHSIQWEVSCNRCHFEENPWELQVLTEDGQVPEPPEEGSSEG